MLLQVKPIHRRSDSGVRHHRRSHSERTIHVPEPARTVVHSIPGQISLFRTQKGAVRNTYTSAKTQYYKIRSSTSDVVDRRLGVAGKKRGRCGAAETLLGSCENPNPLEGGNILDLEWVDLNWDDFK
jgi:hypothetical protein